MRRVEPARGCRGSVRCRQLKIRTHLPPARRIDCALWRSRIAVRPCRAPALPRLYVPAAACATRQLFLATASETCFVELQIAELLLVREKGLELDHGAAERGVAIIERFGELHMAFCIDRHLETGNASETPGRVGDGLDQIGFS